MNPLTAPITLSAATAAYLRDRLARPGVLILGVGNSGNQIGALGANGAAAALIASHPACPQISDAELSAIVDALRLLAGQGDVEAAQLIFRIANAQQELAASAAIAELTADSAPLDDPQPFADNLDPS
jgi:hypothetical protein